MKNENQIKPVSLDLGSFVKNQIDISVRADDQLRKIIANPLKQREALDDPRGPGYGFSRDHVPTSDKKIR